MSAVRITCDLLDTGRVAHGFFTRQGGVSGGVYASLNGGRGSRDDPQAVAENLALMAQALAVTRERFLVPWLTHSPDCVIVDAPFGAERPKCDALVTRTRDPDDGRAAYATITDKGRALRKKMWKVYQSTVSELFLSQFRDRDIAPVAEALDRASAAAKTLPANAKEAK